MTIDAILKLEDGTTFYGKGIGAPGTTSGELCFNTAMTGYQEILSDPSYLQQLVIFTFPHIGNVGTNVYDMEAEIPKASGLIIRNNITVGNNFRNQQHFNAWLKAYNVTGLSGIDTRALTRHLRNRGAQNGVIYYSDTFCSSNLRDIDDYFTHVSRHLGLELASRAGCTESYTVSNKDERVAKFKVVVLDFGVKQSIIKSLQAIGCDIIVVPAHTSANEINAYCPDGVVLSNGPGDPSATASYALTTVKALIYSGMPLFGICLGYQLLALAMDIKIEKMHQGHRGSNHPVQDLNTGKVYITSQNHGFAVVKEQLPECVRITHLSLFDQTVEGFELTTYPVFAVQYHPEASPGPQENFYLFEKFAAMLRKYRNAVK
jgi:carbamoyl-phosphate synthase small subunit